MGMHILRTVNNPMHKNSNRFIHEARVCAPNMPALRGCRVYEGGLQAAMHAAMRPDAASAAARDTVVRAVEQGAALVTTPRDSVNVVLQVGALGARWAFTWPMLVVSCDECHHWW